MPHPSTSSDEDLVVLAKNAGDGDRVAFEHLVHRHQARVLANCRYLTRSAGDADDLAQEVFIKAFFGLPRFEGRASFKTWITRIKTNHCLNHLKKHSGRSFVDIDDEETTEVFEELTTEPAAYREVNAADDRERISEVLDSISDTLRVPLVLRDLDKLSYQEIADHLGLNLSAVKMRIKRGREEFRKLYGPAAEPEADRTASP